MRVLKYFTGRVKKNHNHRGERSGIFRALKFQASPDESHLYAIFSVDIVVKPFGIGASGYQHDGDEKRALLIIVILHAEKDIESVDPGRARVQSILERACVSRQVAVGAHFPRIRLFARSEQGLRWRD